MVSNLLKDFQLVLHVKPKGVISKKPVQRLARRSKNGCYCCKRKKIRCDETKVRCNNCVKSNTECVYPERKKKPKAKVKKVAQVPVSSTVMTQIESIVGTRPDTLPRLPIWKVPENFEKVWDDLASISSFDQNEAEYVLGRFPDSQTTESYENDTLSKSAAEVKSHQNDSSPQRAKEVESREMVQVNSSNTLEKSEMGMPHIRLDFFNLANINAVMDSFFFSYFANRFLPTIAQPHFHHSFPQQSLVLSAGARSEMLREIFVACGASLVAFDNLTYKSVARDKYKQAITHFLNKIKHEIAGSEDWFLVAVQVLQTLCLRDTFGGSNATRCAAHFNAAYKIIVNLLQREIRMGPQFSPLERVMIENFIFNYSITIFYCDHTQLVRLVPNPFDFFAQANSKLTEMSYEDGSPQSSRMSMLAFQLAAKCSWLCRLRLPFDDADMRLHFEMLLFADTILFSLESVDFSGEDVRVQNTVSVAKVVLRSSIILIRKMLDLEGVKAQDLQILVEAIVADIAKPCNEEIIFPIWAIMIAASTTTVNSHKIFFKNRLQKLVEMSKSTIALQVMNHLDGLWEIYSEDEPFELLFDTAVLDQVCR